MPLQSAGTYEGLRLTEAQKPADAFAEPAATRPGRGDDRPTNARYGVLAFSVAMAVILYLDRMAIAVPAAAIAADLHTSLTAIGDSMAAFFWSYALMQVPAGWLGDRWGGRRALTLYVVAWSAAMAGIGLATGLVSLVVMRGLLGVCQAGAYATTASFLRRWMPVSRRGVANSSVSLGGRAGAVLAPVLTPVLMGWAAVAMSGIESWRPVFLLYAVVGVVWAALFWWWFRDTPREHSGCNAAEIALVADGEAEPDGSALAGGAIPIGAMLANRGLLLLAVICFCSNVGWIFLVTWLPTYLIEVHDMSQKAAGFYTGITSAAGMGGCLAGGFATDWLIRRAGLAWGRRLPGMLGHGGAALCLATCWLLDDRDAIVALLIAASFLGDFALGGVWASFQDIGGKYAGTVLGFANMCGNIGAAVAISLIGRLQAGYGWPAAFALGAGAFLFAAISWSGVDPRRSLRTE
jgi:ACS family glucarate transporter-like MFS transporter